MLDGGAHPLRLGLTEEIPFFKNQERLTFARVGVTDPLSLDDYVAHGGFDGLKRALTMAPAEIVEEVWRPACAAAAAPASPPASSGGPSSASTPTQKYIVCNADEGD